MKHKKLTGIAVLAVVCLCIGIHGCTALKGFYTFPPYVGQNNFIYTQPLADSTKKTVFIVADNAGTELFDMMAPYYLFNATGMANVYLVAKQQKPVILRKGLFVLPQLTFNQADSLKLRPAVVVIPALAAMDKKEQDTTIVQWIRKQYTGTTIFLSVCQGSLTAASTGLYNTVCIATHASELAANSTQFASLRWVRDSSFTHTGNLYSTAGVSNAVEGSLAVIEKLFGQAVLHKVMDSVHYPYPAIKTTHQSLAITTGNMLTIGRKIFFSRNKNIGVWLQNGMDEFMLAAVTDTYYRTFPSSIKSYSAGNQPVHSKYGLTLIPTGDIINDGIDELHITATINNTPALKKQPKLVYYPRMANIYPIRQCLHDISITNGQRFERVVERLLDYNAE